MGNCARSAVNERNEEHHLGTTVTFPKSTQTDYYCEEYSPFVSWPKGALSSENAGTSESKNDNQHSRRFEEYHVHVNSKAVIVGNQSKIIVRKDKRKKHLNSLNAEEKQQNKNTAADTSSSSNQSEHTVVNRKSNQFESRQIDLDSSTAMTSGSDDSAEEEMSLRIQNNAIVNLKLCKTAEEIEKIIFELKVELMKLTEARTKSLEKHFLGVLTSKNFSDHSKMKLLDSLTTQEKRTNMYTVI
ncbi:Hypothetical predicted protein [Mytilus galloprovincialis]|uniref:Uncharacterized protein n=1 Tax=Mytilus galloprovincialis TaxID=29158 RepID=A0A8B6F8M2_MYTGA|nr:Hypothetical predicted protein [Mytilus galloprovincialis]